MAYRLLAINPGSTSTKIGVYDDTEPVLIETLRHSTEEINSFEDIIHQLSFRKAVIVEMLLKKNFDLKTLNAVVGRGGLLKPIQSGTYSINDIMLKDLEAGRMGQHASNLGAILANGMAEELNIPSFIVDPVVVDEMEDVARVSGIPEIERKSIFHALNQKAVAKRYAKEKNVKYENVNLIIAHMGGGISVGAHKAGRVIDVNNALDGDGPFSPERSGGLPVGDLVEMCFSGKFTQDDIKKKVTGKGGYVAYLNTNNAMEVESQAFSGDAKAKLVFEAMAYQLAKEIGQCSCVLSGKVNAIILTGGLAHSKAFVDYIKERVSFIAPVVIYPGEDELLALVEGTLRVLTGEEEAKIYK